MLTDSTICPICSREFPIRHKCSIGCHSRKLSIVVHGMAPSRKRMPQQQQLYAANKSHCQSIHGRNNGKKNNWKLMLDSDEHVDEGISPTFDICVFV